MRHDAPRMNEMRILVVEDCQTLAFSLRRYLDFLGYSVQHAATFGEARRALQESDFDCLLADGQLPDGMGSDLIHQLRDRCVMVTMSGLDVNFREGRDARW